MTLPNFLVVGAAKAGTTSIYHYLNQHPNVFLSTMKETNFFALEGKDITFYRYNWARPDALLRSITDIDTYTRQFSKVACEKAVGEVCPSYLFIPDAPTNIAKYISEAKIIIVLRNPIDRAYSHYLELVRQGRERLSFEAAIQQERIRKEHNWFWDYFYTDMGFYTRQIEHYFQTFSKCQIKIMLFDDLVRNTEVFMKDLFEFLDLELIEVDIHRVHNPKWMPRKPWLHSFYKESHPIKTILKMALLPSRRAQIKEWYRGIASVKIEPLKLFTRQKLITLYASEIYNLQELLERNLNEWGI